MDELQKLAETQDEEDRLALLQQLVDQLKPKERHALTRMISIKNDRLAALPVELVIQVLNHLPLLYTWKLRLVSQRWRDLLTSEQIVDAALKRWDTHRPEDRVKTPSYSETSEAIFRRMRAWTLGRPFTKCAKHISIANSNGEHLQQATRTFALSGHYFAYIETLPRENVHVVVLNLITGTRSRYQGAARENIMSLSLTNSIIAYISFGGKLYASRHDHSQLGSVQLPSAAMAAFSADQDIVAVALQGVSSAPTRVVLFDCTDCTTRDFEINPIKAQTDSQHDVKCNIRALLINKDAQTIDIFGKLHLSTDTAGQSRNAYVEHRRYAFTGDYLTSSSWRRIGMRSSGSRSRDDFTIADLHHAGQRGLYVVRTLVLQSADQLPLAGKPPQQMLLCFDSDQARLLEHIMPSDLRASDKNLCRSDSVSPMLWKNMEICADSMLYFSTMSDKDRHTIRNRLQLKSRGLERPNQILVNESFVVATSWLSQAKEWHADIFCFEQDLDWAVHGSEIVSTYLWDATPSTDRTDRG